MGQDAIKCSISLGLHLISKVLSQTSTPPPPQGLRSAKIGQFATFLRSNVEVERNFAQYHAVQNFLGLEK